MKVEPKQSLYWNSGAKVNALPIRAVEPKQSLYWNVSTNKVSEPIWLVEPKQSLYWNTLIGAEVPIGIVSRTQTIVVLKLTNITRQRHILTSRTQTIVVLKHSSKPLISISYLVEPKQSLYWNTLYTSVLTLLKT